MKPRVTDDEARKVIGGSWVFVEPASAAKHYRDACMDLLAARAELAEVRANCLRAYHVTLDGLGAPADEWPCNRVAMLAKELRAELERLRPIVDSVIKAQEAHDACELGRGNAAECDACDRMMEIADDLVRTERARRDGAGREGS